MPIFRSLPIANRLPAPTALRRVRLHSKHTAKYGCLAPLYAPAGVERCWGRGGDYKILHTQPTQKRETPCP
jgi:hypothetical protein